ncbi:MAG: hypothetical protein ACTHMJ_10425 [Thermomicrobiales bacterium]|nr:hypothetical protein [Thermomicrobiales bacterium]
MQHTTTNEVSPTTAVNIPTAMPNTGGGYSAGLAQQQATRQLLWLGALLMLLLAGASASAAVLLPRRND